MANAIYGKNKDETGHHLVWDKGILSHDLLARIIPFVFEKVSVGEKASSLDCKLVARLVRHWARLQKIWLHDLDSAFFRFGITTFMPPFIKKLEGNADRIESVIPGMKREILEIYTKLNFSTFDPDPKHRDDDEDLDAGGIIGMMLEMADFFEKSGGIIPEGRASDDDHRADFIGFVNKKRGTVPMGSMVDAFIDETIRPVIGDDPEFFEYIKKIVTPMAKRMEVA
jgi:hypothetical protein